MTPEEKKAADDAAAAKAAEDKATEDAAFETGLEGLSEEEKTAKRTERASTHTDKNLDDEIAAETERQLKAAEAYNKREADRKAREAAAAAGGAADKPLTRADLESIQEAATTAALKVANAAAASAVARALATSDKEAQLLVLKWQGRTFSPDMSIQDQMEETYAVVNRKKIIGERNEAMRAVRNRGGANTNGAATHRDEPAAGEPKLSDADKTAIKSAGFEWDGAKRLYKKSLKGGRMFLYRDPKSGRTFTGA